MSEGTTNVQFRVGSLAGPVDARRTPGQSAGEIARRDLDRYYAILAAELARLDLSEAEWSAVVDALNGSLLDANTARLLWAEIDDALPDGLAGKWGIDGPALVGKLRTLSPAGAMAVVDTAERYWTAVSRGESPEIVDQPGK